MQITRRKFVEITGASAALVLTGCIDFLLPSKVLPLPIENPPSPQPTSRIDSINPIESSYVSMTDKGFISAIEQQQKLEAYASRYIPFIRFNDIRRYGLKRINSFTLEATLMQPLFPEQEMPFISDIGLVREPWNQYSISSDNMPVCDPSEDHGFFVHAEKDRGDVLKWDLLNKKFFHNGFERTLFEIWTLFPEENHGICILAKDVNPGNTDFYPSFRAFYSSRSLHAPVLKIEYGV
ncbi:MAG: hypothetical protein KJ718_00315 [Nanoarchaeota archaeon]|nr:hypothetical protein [Nanoarchaeota archaeon]MBU1050984.1 hypothetical protein [Nanoarchaeota archaeon]MBU1988509.1 hypothetical protein [Nanoarchaeota archaeon]